MQTDPSLRLQIKQIDHVSVREIEINTPAEALGLSLSNFAAIDQFLDGTPKFVDGNFINQSKAQELHRQLVAKTLIFQTHIHFSGIFSKTQSQKIKLVERNDFGDELSDPLCKSFLNTRQDQHNDTIIHSVFS